MFLFFSFILVAKKNLTFYSFYTHFVTNILLLFYWYKKQMMNINSIWHSEHDNLF